MNRGVIDTGNTRVKAAVFNSEGLLLESMNFDDTESGLAWLKSKSVTHVMAASVGQRHTNEFEGLSIVSLHSNSRLPFINQYKTPETLGVDRIAAMAAASVLFPNKAVLVFDIGTCMTIDLLLPDNTYKGGNISPGLNMRLQAMHKLTGRLPLVSSDIAELGLGNDTESAIANGALAGMYNEIESYISRYLNLYPELQIVFCGGDHSRFDMNGKYRIFAAPEFVLIGLYHLLLLNEN